MDNPTRLILYGEPISTGAPVTPAPVLFPRWGVYKQSNTVAGTVYTVVVPSAGKTLFLQSLKVDISGSSEIQIGLAPSALSDDTRYENMFHFEAAAGQRANQSYTFQTPIPIVPGQALKVRAGSNAIDLSVNYTGFEL